MFTVKDIKLMMKGFNPFEEPLKARFYAPVVHGRFKRFKRPARKTRTAGGNAGVDMPSGKN